MTKPLFSIVTITLNNCDGLIKTHHSIASQSFEDFEWIIMDGASSDKTISYLKQHNVPYLSEPDGGLYDAMNKGLERANGRYIVFMNAGDVFASKETLRNVADTIDQDSPDFIYGDALEILNGEEIYKKARYYPQIDRGMITHHQAMYYKNDALNGLTYDLKYKIAADYDFTLRFMKSCKNIAPVPAPLCLFESGGVSEQNALKGRVEQFKIRHALHYSLWENCKTFILQTLAYFLRKISPKLYWRFKGFVD